MSDDEPDEELLAFLRKSLGLDGPKSTKQKDLRVLKNAQFVCDNSIDVAIDPQGTKKAASTIWTRMQKNAYSLKTWSTHELHPEAKDESTVNFIFTMDLLNFCFWTDDEQGDSFGIDYHGARWTGYWSLVAALQRALEEGIPITSSDYWQDEAECTDEVLRYVFRSDTPTPMPLIEERIACLREAGRVLYERFDCGFVTCIEEAGGSASALVNILIENFPCFKDESRFHGKTVTFHKRAQILVADLWACFEAEGHGKFHDIDTITMFADYRIPQMLYTLGCILYSPPLEHAIRSLHPIPHSSSWEVQLRGCSIWCVELIRRQILREYPGASVNAILIDFFLYDMSKEVEKGAEDREEMIPHHRTKSIYY